ncbi:LECE-like protein [Mya arenaria]|uniref:LECE-like protein n=1 Tax=Mya arenaria TaxID=6604 RepID=A0ABY7F0Y1_MYAAR|nr:LECE-like protein [Mya arenaria]
MVPSSVIYFNNGISADLLGYVQTDDDVTTQSCPGVIPESDRLQTTDVSSSKPPPTTTGAGVTNTHYEGCTKQDPQSFGRSCFKMFQVSRGWADGEKLCLEGGGHLAAITSAEEQAFLQQLIETQLPRNSSVWIGLSDIDKEGHFQWTSAVSVSPLG